MGGHILDNGQKIQTEDYIGWLECKVERLEEALTEDREKWSFETLFWLGRVLLARHYPECVFPSRYDDPSDPGPQLVRALRACITAEHSEVA